jgi:hypothetical protein
LNFFEKISHSKVAIIIWGMYVPIWYAFVFFYRWICSRCTVDFGLVVGIFRLLPLPPALHPVAVFFSVVLGWIVHPDARSSWWTSVHSSKQLTAGFFWLRVHKETKCGYTNWGTQHSCSIFLIGLETNELIVQRVVLIDHRLCYRLGALFHTSPHTSIKACAWPCGLVWSIPYVNAAFLCCFLLERNKDHAFVFYCSHEWLAGMALRTADRSSKISCW